MAGLKLIKVRKRYQGNDRDTIVEFNLDIVPGEFVVLVGPSGCGKSTVLRMIAGLIPVTSGEISIDGEDITDLLAKDRDVAMVFQNYALFPHMSVYENLAFGMRVRKESKEAINKEVMEAAKTLQLESLLKKKPGQLSGGQRQRVALGRAMVRKPKAFLFDEPLSNLDAKLRVLMRREIMDFHDRVEGTTIYVTHDQLEAMTMADRMVILDRGKIQQIGTPSEIYTRPANKFVAGFIGTPPMNFFKGKTVAEGESLFFVSDAFKFCLPDTKKDALEAVTLGIRPEDIYRSDKTPQEVLRSDAISCRIEAIELLGDSSIFHCSLQDNPFRLRIRGSFSETKGDQINLVFDLKKIHLFDKGGIRVSD